MTATKILWGQLLLVALTVLLFIWAATQWVAWRLAFQPELGEPWFELLGLPIYNPLIFFYWWYVYDAYAPHIFMEGGVIAASGGIVSIGVAITMSIMRAREKSDVTTYGSARWAKMEELKEAGLLGRDGPLFGKIEDQFVRHDGPEHIMCFAPTRSGKGVGLVIPTLLTWPASCIVHDIKGENWQLTAGLRAKFGRVLLFDPTNPDSTAYNPLLEVRMGPNEVRDAQNIADILIDPDGSMAKRNHWQITAHGLLVGAILHVLYAEEDKTLAGVVNFLTCPDRELDITLHRMKATKHLGEAGVHPVVASAAQSLINKAQNERSGVVSTAESTLNLYRDPVIAKVTAKSDWRIGDLVDGEHPTSLYLVVPPSDLSRTRPLVRMMLNQIGRRLTESLSGVADRHKLLLMLDEFPALGQLDFFQSQLAYIAGYGIRSVLIAQSLTQIDQAYGKDNSILDNCDVRVTFAANNERTSERISKSVGVATEQRSMQNFAGHRLSPWLGHVMISRQDTPRQLLTPDEVLTFPEDETIILVSGRNPIRAKKIRYYEESQFTARVFDPPTMKELHASQAEFVQTPDDWTSLPIPEVPPPPPKEGEANEGASKPKKQKAKKKRKDDDDDGTIQRKPDRDEPAKIIEVDPEEPPRGEFEFDDPPRSTNDGQQQNPDMRGIARGISLDPDSDMDM